MLCRRLFHSLSRKPTSQDALGIVPRCRSERFRTFFQSRCPVVRRSRSFVARGYEVRWVRVQGIAAAGAFQRSNDGIIRMFGMCRRCRQLYTVSPTDAKSMIATYVMRNRIVPKHLPGICDKCWAKMLAKRVPP